MVMQRPVSGATTIMETEMERVSDAMTTMTRDEIETQMEVVRIDDEDEESTMNRLSFVTESVIDRVQEEQVEI